MSRLLSQLTVDMLEKRATNNATMNRLERCEAVVMGRQSKICELLKPMPDEGPTPYRRFVDHIDAGVARLRTQKAALAIEGVIRAIQQH